MTPKLHKTLKVSSETHYRIRFLAAQRGVSMAALLEDMVTVEDKLRFTSLGADYADKFVENLGNRAENLLSRKFIEFLCGKETQMEVGSIEGITAEDIVDHLRQTGWRVTDSQNLCWEVWEGASDYAGKPLEIVLPKNRQAPDMALYIKTALNTMAQHYRENPAQSCLKTF